MSVTTFIIGYIVEAWPGRSGSSDPEQLARLEEIEATIREHSEKVLRELPEEGVWPPLCRPMFSLPPASARMIVHRRRLIHFGAALHELDFEVRDWLDKFESLLRNLYWHSAYVRVEAVYVEPSSSNGRRRGTGWMTCLELALLR